MVVYAFNASTKEAEADRVSSKTHREILFFKTKKTKKHISSMHHDLLPDKIKLLSLTNWKPILINNLLAEMCYNNNIFRTVTQTEWAQEPEKHVRISTYPTYITDTDTGQVRNTMGGLWQEWKIFFSCKFFILKLSIFILYTGILSACISMHHMHTWCPQR